MSDLYKNRCITPESKRLLLNLIHYEDSLERYCQDEMNNYFRTHILGLDPIHISFNHKINLAKQMLKVHFEDEAEIDADCTSSN